MGTERRRAFVRFGSPRTWVRADALDKVRNSLASCRSSPCRPAMPWRRSRCLLIGIHGVLGLLWLSSLVLAVARIGAWLNRSAVRRVIDGAVGAVMTGFGAKLALEEG